MQQNEEKMNIKFDNVFLCVVQFNLNQVEKYIIAQNKQDAINTLQSYYNDPIILSLMSLQELLDINDRISAIGEPYYLLMETVSTPIGIDFITYEEIGMTMEQLEEKYKDKNVVALNKGFLQLQTQTLINKIQQPRDDLLLSESFVL